MGKHLVLLDSYKNVLFHNKIVRFIRKLVIQYVQTLYNLYADSCGFMWILRTLIMMVPASEVEASSSRCADHMVMDGQSVTC